MGTHFLVFGESDDSWRVSGWLLRLCQARSVGRMRCPSATSGPVRQPLALEASKGKIGALHVIAAEIGAVRVPEIELAQTVCTGFQ
jgi:hypothetical protein